jgi:hypothetical protein
VTRYTGADQAEPYISPAVAGTKVTKEFSMNNY